MMIAVLGAGSWGTTLANLLARKAEAQVRIWAYEPEVVEAINSRHENPVFLPGTALDDRLAAYGDARRAVEGADLVLSVIPSHAVRSVVSRLRGAVPSGTIVVSATKGIEIESLKLMSEVLGETLDAPRIAILSGPSFAEEVGAGQPTAVVAAAERQETADRVQEVFSTPVFRVYSNLDVIGVQLAGALKNVIAIAAGMIEGLGLGNNPRAALVTRGLAEMTRVGVARGADPMTFAGLAGLGDLLLTTCGALSRNRALGVALAEGQNFQQYTAAHRTVAEGAYTARAAVALARTIGVEMPITEQVHAVLYEGQSPRQALHDLLGRALRPERWT